MSLPSLRLHTDALIAALQGLGLTVGDAEAPNVSAPYVTVYPIAGGSRNGTIEAPDDDAELVYQVTCVGQKREQAEWLADKVLTLLGKDTISVTGRKISRVSLQLHPTITRSDDTAPPLFYATPRLRVWTTSN